MTGTKQFDISQALDGAMRIFWEKGFEGTSYGDLIAATGLSKSSLYNAFGGKQDLYNSCLNHYTKVYGSEAMAQLEAPVFEDAVTGFLDTMIERFQRDDLPDGCMATAAALEFGAGHKSQGERVKGQLQRAEAALLERCKKAMTDGDLPLETDCEAVASFLLAMTRGLAAIQRGYGNVEAVLRAKHAMIEMLKAPPLLKSDS